MDNKSENIRNYSITFLCIVAAFYLIFYTIYLNNKIKVQQELLTKVDDTKTELFMNIDRVYEDYKFYVDEQMTSQANLKKNAEKAVEAFNGIVTIFSARLMESEDMISRGDADLLVIESISKIKKTNQTLAELISIINRNWINRRWK